jgi:hypothetical protein
MINLGRASDQNRAEIGQVKLQRSYLRGESRRSIDLTDLQKIGSEVFVSRDSGLGCNYTALRQRQGFDTIIRHLFLPYRKTYGL